MASTPLLAGRPPDAALDRQLLSPLWRGFNLRWLAAVAFTGAGSLLFLCLIVYTMWFGIGLWGNQIPVAWAFGIINFVFWIEIAHAGTFTSAVLLLLEQRWRTSVNRIAEAMTIFAVVIAGIFPLLHLGRPWFFDWLLPYPGPLNVYPNFRSSLPWDAVAVFAYGFVSALFWYMGMIPDLAALRDSSPGLLKQRLYGLLALGWTGSARAVRHFRVAYGLMAGLVTALVTVTITIISMDFSISILPGWHTTIFPPYFIAAALYSGFGMIVTLVTAMRFVYRLDDVITNRHLDVLGKMLLLTGTLTLYAYVAEFFMGWYSGSPYEGQLYWHQYWTAPKAAVWWLTLALTLMSQVYWSKKVRTHAGWMFVLSILVNVGMWGDRFSFIVLPLERDFLTSSWKWYGPTWVDFGLLIGSVCFFFFMFLMFARFLPFIPVAEVKELRRELQKEATTPADIEMQRRERLVAEGRRGARRRRHVDVEVTEAERERPAREHGIRHAEHEAEHEKRS